MAQAQIIVTPLSDETIAGLHTGDKLILSGVIYTARDAAHKQLIKLIEKGEKLPFDIEGQIIYYVGPTPPKPGAPIGSAGPTTSGRMDAYAPHLIERGLKGMIGKGQRSQRVRDALAKYIRQKGQPVTVFVGEGLEGPVKELYIACRRRDLKWILPEVRQKDPKAFYVIEQARDMGKVLKPIYSPLGGWRAVQKRK